MDFIKLLLPKDKFDNSNIAQIAQLNDEEIQPIIYDLLEWLQDANFPIFKDILPIVAHHQNLVMPYVIAVLQDNDVMWKYWIIESLIPLLSDNNKLRLKSDLLRLSFLQEKDEDTQAIIEVSKNCLDTYYTK